jgi:hypothetical protein
MFITAILEDPRAPATRAASLDDSPMLAKWVSRSSCSMSVYVETFSFTLILADCASPRVLVVRLGLLLSLLLFVVIVVVTVSAPPLYFQLTTVANMNRQLLSRATENSDAPTPGYMYLDIAKNAATNPSTCSDIAKYLTARLASKNNPNIKHKCLKVISKTATSPYLRGQFKRCLAQDPQAMAAIKDALQFRGPPDPVRGDQPFERVRTAAKEALDAVYSDTPVDSTGAPFATSTSTSYGASPHQQQGGYGGQASYGGGGGGGGRMEGIGNPMFKDPRLEPQGGSLGTINDFAKEAKNTVIGIIKDPLARNSEVSNSNRTGEMPRPGGGSGGGYSGATVSLNVNGIVGNFHAFSVLTTFLKFIFIVPVPPRP